MRAVVDTNVFLSGLLWKGVPSKIIEAWVDGKFKLIVSNEIVQEYEAVLNRMISHNQMAVSRAIESVRFHAEYVQPVLLNYKICRDPKDEIFITSALAGKADYIVSGDKDLLVLEAVTNVKIVTPRTFYDLF